KFCRQVGRIQGIWYSYEHVVIPIRSGQDIVRPVIVIPYSGQVLEGTIPITEPRPHKGPSTLEDPLFVALPTTDCIVHDSKFFVFTRCIPHAFVDNVLRYRFAKKVDSGRTFDELHVNKIFAKNFHCYVDPKMYFVYIILLYKYGAARDQRWKKNPI